MRRAWVILSVGMFVLALFFMSGCKQLEGERCQMDSDCEEGLICCVIGNVSCQPRGKCNFDAGTDSAPKVDAPIVDAPLLDAPLLDAPPADAPPADAPLLDAPPAEAPVVDAPIIDKSVAPDKTFTPDTKPVVDSNPMDKALAKE